MLATIAHRIGGTPGQVIFKWAHAKGFVVVTTTSTRTRLHEYLDVVHLRASPSSIPPQFLVVIFHPTLFFSSSLADLTPGEIEAIDEAGAKGPPGLTQSWLRNISRTRVARTRVVLGVLAIPFVIMLLCCLGWPALL